MTEIKTQESINQEKRDFFLKAMNILGDVVELKKRIKFRKTPHTPSVYIYKLEKDKGLDYYGEAKDTVLQVLRGLLNKNQTK